MGESCVEPTLARHPVGVARCGAASGRVFRGTLMVEPEQYRGDARLGVWFELAAAHNRTLEAKAPSEKPRAKKRASASGGAAGRAAGRAAGGAEAAGARAKRAKAGVVKVEELLSHLAPSYADLREQHERRTQACKPSTSSGVPLAACHVQGSRPRAVLQLWW